MTSTVYSDVDIVFRDLADALEDLNANRPSPKEVRRAFSRFVGLTQKLTATMRVEFKARTGEKWRSGEFPGWNNVTNLFKELWDVDEHEAVLLIQVRERQYLQVGSGAAVVFEGTWDQDDPQAERPPDGLVAVEADPKTGLPTDKVLPTRREIDFVLSPRTQKAQHLLKACNTDDVHVLAEECFRVLEAYHEFYQKQVADAAQK